MRRAIVKTLDCIRIRLTRSPYTRGMDVLDGLLDGPRARGAFLLRSIMEPPWCLRVQDQAPLTLVGLVRGAAWVVPDVGEPVR